MEDVVVTLTMSFLLLALLGHWGKNWFSKTVCFVLFSQETKILLYFIIGMRPLLGLSNFCDIMRISSLSFFPVNYDLRHFMRNRLLKCRC